MEPVETATKRGLRLSWSAALGLAVAFGTATAQTLPGTSDAGRWADEFGLWQGPSGPVRAMAFYDGDLIVAGDFVAVGRMPARYVARWDGSLWHDVSAPFESAVYSLAVHDGSLFAAAGPRVARWDGVSWQEIGVASGGGGVYGPWVAALDVYAGRLVAAGMFDSLGGSAADEIAAWDGAAWRPLGAGLGGVETGVHDLAMYGGELIAAGDIVLAGGAPTAGVARWNGTSWSALGSGVSTGGSGPSVIRDLGVSGGFLFASGQFSIAGGRPAQNLARWDGTDWIPTSGGTLSSFVEHLGSLLSLRNGAVVRWNGADWEPIVAKSTVDADPPLASELASDGTSLYAAGEYLPQIAGVHFFDVARWDTPRWTRLSSPEGLGFDAPVTAFAVVRDTLLAAGRFTRAGAVPVQGLVKWDGAGWQPFGMAISGVNAVVVKDGELFVAGIFERIGGRTFNSVARWNGVDWVPVGTGLRTRHDFDYTDPAEVLALAVYRGDLVAAGDIRYDGEDRALGQYGGVVRWDGVAWHPLGDGVGGGDWGLVRSLAVEGDSLIAGGDFYRPVEFVASWDGTAWTTLGNITGLSNARGLRLWRGNLYACGTLEFPGGATFGLARWDGAYWNEVPPRPAGGSNGCVLHVYRDRLVSNDAFWDGVSWVRPGGGLGGSNPRTFAAVEYRGNLWLGGNFSSAAGERSFHVARWDEPSTPIEVESFEAVATEAGARLAWRLSFEASRELTGVVVEAAPAAPGPFEGRTPRPLAPRSTMSWTDANARRDATTWYRLGLMRDGASVGIAGPIAFQPGAAAVGRTELDPLVDPGPGRSVSVRFQLAERATVHLAVHDARGRLVRVLEQGRRDPGVYLHTWDRRDARGGRAVRGVYFVRLAAATTVRTGKLVILHE